MRWLVVVFLAFPLFAASPYVRIGAGLERGRDTVLRDRDCTSAQPAALFGCGFEARGELDRTPVVEFAIGTGDRTRLELAFAHRELELDATSNFTGVTGEQNVSARVQSLSMMVNGAMDLAPAAWRVRPFITAGAGAASNGTSRVVYAFPGIGPNAVTITRGGLRTGFAWNAGAGATLSLTPQPALELTGRPTTPATMHSPRGTATIIRPTRTIQLEIDETRADLETRGVALSLRDRT